MKGLYTFRKITNEEELKHFMQLRYQTYQNSALNCILKENKHQIDISIFDLHAEHFGLFYNGKPAGYLRFIFKRNEKFNTEAFEIGKAITLFDASRHNKTAIQSIKKPEFPFLNYPDITQEMQTYYSTIKKEQEYLIEPSRMTIFKEFKGLGASRFILECGIVLTIIQCTGRSHGLVCCHRKYANCYQQYGLKRIAGSERSIKIEDPAISDYQYESLELLFTPRETIEQTLSHSDIPKQFHHTFSAMYKEYKNNNHITRKL